MVPRPLSRLAILLKWHRADLELLSAGIHFSSTVPYKFSSFWRYFAIILMDPTSIWLFIDKWTAVGRELGEF
jgi:hypothetical protein